MTSPDIKIYQKVTSISTINTRYRFSFRANFALNQNTTIIMAIDLAKQFLSLNRRAIQILCRNKKQNDQGHRVMDMPIRQSSIRTVKLNLLCQARCWISPIIPVNNQYLVYQITDAVLLHMLGSTSAFQLPVPLM